MVGRETKHRELKEKVTDSFLKTVSAFSNYGSGDIWFGMNDYGEIEPLEDPEKTALDVENKINDAIVPRPEFSISLDPETGCVVVRVEEGGAKPYLYKSKAYKRSDTSTVPVDAVELRRLMLEGANLAFDELETDESDFTFNDLSHRLIKKLSISGFTKDTLKTLGLMSAGGRYTNAGALFADTNSFPGVDIAKFGSDINRILDRETIEGTSILEQYEEAVSAYRRYYQYEEIAGIERIRRERIPENAFREAVANALVHRAWDVAARIRLELYDDRIEVVSPGGLPSGLSEDDYLNGQVSILRNPVVGNVFFRLGLIENFGTGIRRIREAYAEGDVAPSFQVTANALRVVLPALDGANKLTADERLVLDALSKLGVASSTEIIRMTVFGKDKVLKLLTSLESRGLVAVEGAGRATRYRVLNSGV